MHPLDESKQRARELAELGRQPGWIVILRQALCHLLHAFIQSDDVSGAKFPVDLKDSDLIV
jgi:hypothetical protein